MTLDWKAIVFLNNLKVDIFCFFKNIFKVNPKRTNRPGISSTNRPPRGRSRRGGRGFTSGFGGFAPRSRRGFGYVQQAVKAL